jgi:hypothetical protein
MTLTSGLQPALPPTLVATLRAMSAWTSGGGFSTLASSRASSCAMRRLSGRIAASLATSTTSEPAKPGRPAQEHNRLEGTALVATQPARTQLVHPHQGLSAKPCHEATICPAP